MNKLKKSRELEAAEVTGPELSQTEVIHPTLRRASTVWAVVGILFVLLAFLAVLDMGTLSRIAVLALGTGLFLYFIPAVMVLKNIKGGRGYVWIASIIGLAFFPVGTGLSLFMIYGLMQR